MEKVAYAPNGEMILPRELKLLSTVRTPRTIHKFVDQLAALIGPQKPMWVPVKPTKEAKQGECFFNVPKQVETKGGKIQFGWTVWQCANLFIEGEFHAVWISPKGEPIDITPKGDGETRIMFIPDNTRTFQNERVDNIRLAILDRPEIHEFLSVASQSVRYMKANTVGNIRQFRGGEEWDRLQHEKGRLSFEVSKYILPPSSLCPCDSNRYFGNCCGKLI